MEKHHKLILNPSALSSTVVSSGKTVESDMISTPEKCIHLTRPQKMSPVWPEQQPVLVSGSRDVKGDRKRDRLWQCNVATASPSGEVKGLSTAQKAGTISQ